MVDFTFTEEQQRWRQIAREFAQQEVAPVAWDLDRQRDPTACVPLDLVRKASKLGLRTLTAPKEWGGGGADCLTLCLVGEELSTADTGVAVMMDQCWKLAPLLYHLGTDDQKERFLRPFMADDDYILATVMTEPMAGTDNIMPYDVVEAGVRTTAVRDGDDWVLNGTKIFTSCGSIASLYIFYARTDRKKKLSEGTSAFLVPAGTPGFTIGRVDDKIGQRLVPNAEEVLDNVRVPQANMLGPEGQIMPLRRKYVVRWNIEASMTMLGVGRSAYEHALKYAKTKVQNGQALIEGQATAMMLAEMAMRLEAARQLVWYAAWASDYQVPYDRKLSPMAKIIASETTLAVAKLAYDVFGANAPLTDYPIEKLLRDAVTFPHSDGTNQILRLRIAGLL